MSTEKVATFVSDIHYDNLPKEVVDQAKKAIRDIICVSISAHFDEAVKAARKMVLSRGGKGESSLIGIDEKYPCDMAAFVNSIMASTQDMDDGSMGLPNHMQFHRGHPGGILIPAALAVSEKTNAAGTRLIEAVVAGYEVALSKAWLIGKTVLAGETGTVGATAAASKLLGLNKSEIREAFNIVSAHCPAPSYAFIWKRMGMTKEAAAWGAMTGVAAALLAENGFMGTPSFFDLPELSNEPLESLGRDWEILSLYFKKYSACRHAHAPIDGVIELMDAYRLTADDIQEVFIGCASQKGMHMSNPRPNTIWQAQYSIPFVISTAIIEKEVGPNQITEERLRDEKVLKLAAKVRLFADSEVEELQPGTLSARVTVHIKDGSKYETFIRHPKGDPENPLTEGELIAKFKSLAGRIISPEKTQDLFHYIGRLEEVKNIGKLMAQLRNLNPNHN